MTSGAGDSLRGMSELPEDTPPVTPAPQSPKKFSDAPELFDGVVEKGGHVTFLIGIKLSFVDRGHHKRSHIKAVRTKVLSLSKQSDFRLLLLLLLKPAIECIPFKNQKTFYNSMNKYKAGRMVPKIASWTLQTKKPKQK